MTSKATWPTLGLDPGCRQRRICPKAPERSRTSSGRPRAELGRPKHYDHGQGQPPRQSEPDGHSNALAISASMIRRCRLLCQCRLVHGAVLMREIAPNVQLRAAAPWTRGQVINSCAAHQDLPLVGRCRAVLRLDLLQQLDGGEIVGGAQAPGGGQASIAGEPVVGRQGKGAITTWSCLRGVPAFGVQSRGAAVA